jgi:hypothetical protein
MFIASDIAELAEKAKLKPIDDADNWRLAVALERAFFPAHTAGYRTRRSPPPAELRGGFDGAARAAREFLKALGVAGDASAIVGMDRESIARDAGILGALVRTAHDKSDCLPDDVISAYSLSDDAEDWEGRRKIAGERVLVEAARFAAYLSLVAEDAKVEISEAPSRRGPQKDFFSPVLLEALAGCYRQMFGDWPVVKREPNSGGGLSRRGPAVKWLREVLALARHQLEGRVVKSAEEVLDDWIGELRRRRSYVAADAAACAELEEQIDRLQREKNNPAPGETVRLLSGKPRSYFSAREELLSAVVALQDIELETLGSKFEDAIRQARLKAPSENREPQALPPSGQ